MTGDDLKRMQDTFFAGAKQILLEGGRLRPVGFVITLHKHVDKLLESGWGLEFIDPKACLRDPQDDAVATLVVDLAMDWKRIYHAVMNVFPQTQSVLPSLITIGKEAAVDDPYMRVMRAFLKATEMDEKDVVAATMRQICGKVEAFACIHHSEAWLRQVDPSETRAQIPKSLGQDMKSVEILMSAMETYAFARMITVPIQREPSETRDGGKVLGFGELADNVATPENGHVIEGRLARFLKPLPVAS